MSGEVEQLKGIVRAAVKLGDDQAALIVDKLDELRKLKQHVRTAIHLMETGRHQDAVTLLKGLLHEPK